MDATTSSIASIDQLDPDVIRARLVDLRNQATALRILLRAAVRHQNKPDGRPSNRNRSANNGGKPE